MSKPKQDVIGSYEAKWLLNKIEMLALREQNAALAAENERLRKAGDALRGLPRGDDEASIVEYNEAIAAWNAAKEGRDAK